jgi:hypothetical protein
VRISLGVLMESFLERFLREYFGVDLFSIIEDIL